LARRGKPAKIAKAIEANDQRFEDTSMIRTVAVFVVGAFVPLAFPQEDAKKFKLDATETKLLELTNAERKKEDLPPLKADPILCKVAREHSKNMAQQEMLAHDLDCKSPFDRIKEAGYRFGRAGENIAYGSECYPLADIMKNWMESEGHRANIMHKDYTEIGLGAARNNKGDIYYTQVFATPLR
jgi:uncharacterized protein YkwD